MIITPHIITGASIAVLPISPAVSLPLAILSHFVLDYIPHLGTGQFFEGRRPAPEFPSKEEIFIGISDGILSLFLLILLYAKLHNALLFWGALAGISIDIIDNIPYWRNLKNNTFFGKLNEIHLKKFHNDVSRKKWAIGAFNQLFLILIILWLLLK